MEEAKKLQSLGMWDQAVTQARKVLEATCYEVCEEEDITGKRPASSLSLDDMLAAIERSSIKIPKSTPKIMRVLQLFGNLTTHDQREASSINENICTACMMMLDELFEWFDTTYCEGLRKKKTKTAASRKTALVKSASEFYEQLELNSPGLQKPLEELFKEAETLGIKLEWGSRSRSLKSNFSVTFPEDGNTDELKRNFNFGVLKSTGIFYNRSCERSLGRDYLKQLSAIIPNTEVRIHPNEFRNSIVQKNGDPVPLEWIVSRRKEWLQLVGDFLSKLKR